MSLPIKKEEKYTYGDCLTWPENERWEIIDGAAYEMTAAPSRMHQSISGELFYQIKAYLKGKSCKVYDAPFDVRLPEGNEKDEDIETVVQPDIVVVCDPSKLDDRGCKGAPNLIIEILSPFTAKKDLEDKLYLYEKAGVKEYWIVHPTDKTVMVFKLEESNKYGRYKIYSAEDILKASIFEDFEIVLKDIFEE